MTPPYHPRRSQSPHKKLKRASRQFPLDSFLPTRALSLFSLRTEPYNSLQVLWIAAEQLVKMRTKGYGMEPPFPKWIAGVALAGMIFSPFSQTVLAASSPGEPPVPTVKTTPVASSSVLYGTIRSVRNGTPLAHVPIVLTNVKTSETFQGTTTSQGSYIFSGLSPGDYKIRVGGGNFSIQRKEGLLKSGIVGEIDFAVNPLATGSSELLGRTFEGHGDHKIPVPARLAVKNSKTGEIYSVTSDDQGAFDLKNIPSGDYVVQAIKRGYVPYVSQVAVNGKVQSDIRLRINRLAQANINTSSSKKIRDTTGAISVVGRKKFVQNLTTGASYALMLNSPSIEFFSRSGSQGITGGFNYFSCRGYTVGAANNVNTGVSGIEISLDGVPLNNGTDGGEIYDLGVLNTDIASADIQRGVTTSRQMGNFAAGCAINFETVQPTRDSYSTISGGGGSYGLYYTSYINNSGIDQGTGVGLYNDFTIIGQNGFRNFTGLTQYQYYGNATKYLENGKIYLILTGSYKNYDRGGAISLQDLNTFGSSYNGLPNGEIPSAQSGVNLPTSPFYKNWDYARLLLDQGFDDQINSVVRIKNSAFGLFVPNGVVGVPAAYTGSTAGTGGATGLTFNQVSPDYNNQYGSPFIFDYMQSQGMKIGDIPEVQLQVLKNDKLYVGMRGSYQNYRFYINPLFNNITGGFANADLSETTIGAYIEDHYRPTDKFLISAGFRIMSDNQYFNNLASPSQNALLQQNPHVPGEIGVSDGNSIVIPMPHLGINYYPGDHWKIYVTGGESFAPPNIYAMAGLSPQQVPTHLQAETIWDLSLGVRYTSDRGFIAGDVFSDYINNMYNTVLVPINNILTPIPTNTGSARQQGIELDGKINLGAGFGLEANYSYIEAVLGSDVQGLGGAVTGQINTTGDLIPFVPQGMGNLALTYDHGPFHITIDERYTGVMNVIDFSGGPTGNGNFQANSPAYFVTDLFATYDLPKLSWYKKANLFASAYNLFNTNYYNPAFLTPGANSIETLFVYPGEPVNVFGGISMTF